MVFMLLFSQGPLPALAAEDCETLVVAAEALSYTIAADSLLFVDVGC